MVGNASEKKAAITLRSLEMESTTCYADARLSPIANLVTLTGEITSSVDIASAQALFTPVEQIVALSDTVMLLPFDEPAGGLWFENTALPSNGAHCTIYAGCPTAGEAGRKDRAVRFTDGNALIVEHAPAMDFDAGQSFILQGWIKATKSGAIIMQKVGIDATGYILSLDANGRLILTLNGATRVVSDFGVVDNAWHHVAAVVDRSREAILYVDGAEAGYDS